MIGPAAISLLPVPAFLGLLRMLDSFKLMSPRRTAQYMLTGAVAAGICYGINTAVFALLGADDIWYVRWGVPVLEEALKAAWLIAMIRANRIGFLVDAAISGFAIGTGFALVENLTYLVHLTAATPLVWVIRGLGTATLHGGTTAIVGTVSSSLAERRGAASWRVYLPGLAIAIAIHAAYNSGMLNPMTSAALKLIAVPILLGLVFLQSESALRKWIGDRLDKDVDLLHAIASGEFSGTHAGRYLQSLKSSFAPETVGDMLCLLQLSLDLGVQAKGDLMMREMGFEAAPDPTLGERLKELKYLEESVGAAGRRAIAPLLSQSTRDLWQIYMLGERL